MSHWQILKTEPRTVDDLYRELVPGQPIDSTVLTNSAAVDDKFWIFCAWRYWDPQLFLPVWAKRVWLKTIKKSSIQEILFYRLHAGDLVQGGEIPAWWDWVFPRHKCRWIRSVDSVNTSVPLLATGKKYGPWNGGYGRYHREVEFAPVIVMLGEINQPTSKLRISDPLQKSMQSYYRRNYGPIHRFWRVDSQ